MRKIIEAFSLIVGLSAIITIVYYLITDSSTCFLPYEPILWIRIPEIIIGIIAIFLLLRMLFRFSRP